MKYSFEIGKDNFIIGFWADEKGIEVKDEDAFYLPCCRFIDGKVVLDDECKRRYDEHLRQESLKREKEELETWLSEHDYIGTKIAAGRATIEEYADIIEEMNLKASRINEIVKTLDEE